jgi:hypothetical protein
MAGRTRGAVAACAALLLWAPAGAAVREQSGTFAYYGLRRYVTAHIKRVAPNRLDLVQVYLRTGQPVRYVLVGGAPIHFFLVRDDFRTFTHTHPRLRGGGHFIVETHPEKDHRYYAYVDSFIEDIGEQTLRFTVQAGAPPHHLDVTLERPSSAAQAGPYRITLSTARFQAGVPMTIAVSVMRGNRVVTPPKMRSFDAVAAIINTSTLEYVSVYEGHAAGLWYPGEYDRPQLRLPSLPAGIYRMWLQLGIENRTYMAPFTLGVQ